MIAHFDQKPAYCESKRVIKKFQIILKFGTFKYVKEN